MFAITWDNTPHASQRFKLLVKITERNLILNERVVERILRSDDYQDWFAFVDGVIDSNQISKFREAWDELDGGKILKMLQRKRGENWARLCKILTQLIAGIAYEKGT